MPISGRYAAGAGLTDRSPPVYPAEVRGRRQPLTGNDEASVQLCCPLCGGAESDARLAAKAIGSASLLATSRADGLAACVPCRPEHRSSRMRPAREHETTRHSV